MLVGDGNYRLQTTRKAEDFSDAKIGDIWAIRDPDNESFDWDNVKGFAVRIKNIRNTWDMMPQEWADPEGYDPAYFEKGEPTKWTEDGRPVEWNEPYNKKGMWL